MDNVLERGLNDVDLRPNIKFCFDEPTDNNPDYKVNDQHDLHHRYDKPLPIPTKPPESTSSDHPSPGPVFTLPHLELSSKQDRQQRRLQSIIHVFHEAALKPTIINNHYRLHLDGGANCSLTSDASSPSIPQHSKATNEWHHRWCTCSLLYR